MQHMLTSHPGTTFGVSIYLWREHEGKQIGEITYQGARAIFPNIDEHNVVMQTEHGASMLIQELNSEIVTIPISSISCIEVSDVHGFVE